MKLEIETAAVFEPLLYPARYKGGRGGRGSGKSHFFAELLVDTAICKPGLRAVGIREVQKTLKESAKKLIENKIQSLGVGSLFEVQYDQIRTPGGGTILFQGMKDHSAESIKSLEDIDIAWVEEGQTLSQRSLSLLRPTIRGDNSEIWFSWNPTRKSDAVDVFLRDQENAGAVVVESNWSDNPWFPKVLEAERQLDLKLYPERYSHTWEGAYATAFEGGYYAKELLEAKRGGRVIDNLVVDPLLRIYSFCDIGGAGQRADAFTMWIVQFINDKVHLLDYYESRGQSLEYHVNWLRDNGWGRSIIVLPHDGANANAVSGKQYKDHWSDAGFETLVVKNQGQGAAMNRITAARRMFGRCWFEKSKTEAGRDALGFYHEKKDETRNIGLGPDHDWSSHAADSFGMIGIKLDDFVKILRPLAPIGRGGGGWMGS